MTEYSAVQAPMLRYANEIGWHYVMARDALALRGGETGLAFAEIFKAQVRRLNPGVVDAAAAEDLLRRLSLLTAGIDGNRTVLAWLRGDASIYVAAEGRERNVRLIDYDNVDNNLFHVTDEWWHRGTVYRNRADVVFLVNGLPVAICETKAAGKHDALAQGVKQIRRYHRETPEMLLAPQVFEVTQLLDFFYGVTWNTGRKNLFDWREGTPASYESRVKTFFDRSRFLKVLRDYIVFLNRDTGLAKLMLRPHQSRAIEKVIERVDDPTRRRGLIWHTQGSGKTLTMIGIAARLLREAFDKLAEEVVQAETRRRALGLDPNTFAIYAALHPDVPALTAEQARAVDALFMRFPDYRWDDQHQRDLRAELYKQLRPLVAPVRLIPLVTALLRLQRV